ncbi:hypothetical protein CDV55_104983 [Aspergillus turcosus]|uniref:BRCT domain-containing protein n=1 Tax=Aspergillus turcosus TaxID=1245748 RepID=A0A229YX80_9EURO|nr:hypothetical protein CDV55_104983 [Aspergillus turcosus]RLL97812.1 hypothetical protein CFD26_104812 [Aspergillus turcosus]
MAKNSTSNKEHPLAGVVLCFTSILPEQRTELATIASQMGAAHKFDLTSDVTHLLVGDINTAKYKFVARERSDVVVLKPEWVEAVRQSWMQGEDTDIRALEQQYRLPTFMGLAICITGFEDMAYRNYIQETAVSHGADFRKDLTKSVTHLIARNTEGDKYKFATQWNIKVVTMKWFTDSIERGMVLDETLYHPLLPQEQQGVGAWNRTAPPAKEKAAEAENSSNPRPRKLRRIASTKLVDQNEGIWGAIVGSGFENNELRRSTNSQPKSDNLTSSEIARKASVVQEVKSFASETTFAEGQGSRQDTSEVRPANNNGFLDGCYFFIYGFSPKQTSVLRHHLSYNGAQLVSTLGEFSRPEIPKRGHGLYTIVSYKTPRSEIPSTDDLAFECDVVTDMWLERCLEAKTLVPPESHIACTPLPVFPIPGFHGMKICSTGFSRIDLLHLLKLVDLIGATYDEYLTPKASVLVCNDSRSMNNEKLRHTSEWKIPAVTVDWLWSSIQSGQRKAFEPYIIQRLSQPEKSLEVRAGSRTEQKHLSEPSDKPNRTAQPDPRNTESKRPDVNESKSTAVEKPSKPSSGDDSAKPPLPYKRPLQSASVSPTKETKPTNTASPSNKRKASDPCTTSAQSAIELAVSGFLKQARAANSRSKSDTTDQESDSLRRRRRKPLLGRAPSHSSAQGVFSRASSIDTLNEDGCGSAVESINTEGFNSFLTGGRLELPESQRRIEEEENEEPAMTQLNYEDPDAVKMREEFLSHAGKLSNKKESANQGVVVGEVRELEDVGWGTGRRTRNAVKDSEDEL